MGDTPKELGEAYGLSLGVIGDSLKYITKECYIGDCAANTTVTKLCWIPTGEYRLRKAYYVFTALTGDNAMNLNVYKDDTTTKMMATTNMAATAADTVASAGAYSNTDGTVTDGDFVLVTAAGADNATLTEVHVTLVFEKLVHGSYGGG